MAELPSTYSAGTVSVGAGSTTVTGVGTNWVTAGLEAGDIFWAAGLSVRIATVNSATSITLAYPWPGSALSGSNYEVRFTPDATRVLSSARAVLSSLTNGNISSLGSLTTAANKLAYYTGAGVAALTDLTSEARTLLGSTALSRSGTVYTLNGSLAGTAVTQSANDSTAGRLMKVFDFGIGNAANSTPISSAGALSTFPSGLSRISGGSSEQPVGVGTGTVFTACNQSGRMAQQVHGTQNNKLYIRSSHDSVWTAWAEVMTSNNVTQTALDTTAGRLMKVGDFGLGGAISLTATNNLDTLFTTGFYYNPSAGNTTGNNYPPGISGGGALFVLSRSTTNVVQKFISYGGTSTAAGVREFNRSWGTSGWSPWVEVFHQGTLLGTVSQSSGVPTGKVIERGSNANGEYVRFADGTQICTARLTINSTISAALLGGYRNAGQTWSYPAAFAAAPQVTGSPGSLASLSVITNNAGPNAVSVFHISVASQGTAADLVANMVAVGRWF